MENLEKNDSSKQFGNRHYKSIDLPTFHESHVENKLEISKAIYSEVNSNFRHLSDVRFKLLGFVPAVSIIVWAELLGKIPATDFLMSISGLLIGILGLRVTHGIRIYDQRNDQLYDDLISRGRKIEEEWGIHTGIFKGRIKSNKKDVFSKAINHGRGLSLIYKSIYVGWVFICLWYVGNMAYRFLS